MHQDQPVVCLVVTTHHAENGLIHRILDVDYPPPPFPDQTRKEEYLVHPVFCIVDTGSCSEFAFISNVEFCRFFFGVGLASISVYL